MTYSITISGMGCEHCVRAVTEALSSIGAQSLNVELGSARFEFSGGEDEIRAAVDDAGFDVTNIEAK